MILNFIYKRNLLSFDLVLSKHSIDGNLTLVIPILLTLLSNTCVLLFIWSTISLNYFIITTCKSFMLSSSTILVSLSHEIVTFNIIAIGALGGIASILLSYYDLSNEYVTELCAVNMVKSVNRLGI